MVDIPDDANGVSWTINDTILSYMLNGEIHAVIVEQGQLWGFRGTDNNDTFTGDEANNRFVGAKGDDHLIGNGGDDILKFGTGNDLAEGGSGNDTYIFGGYDGENTIIETSGFDVIGFTVIT